jgi:hypothetical protein
VEEIPPRGFIYDMEKDKKIEALSLKLELLTEMLKNAEEETKTLELNLRRMEGFSLGAKDVSDKLKEYSKKNSQELILSLKEGKISQPAAQLIEGAVVKTVNFAKEKSDEADRLFYIRQGELLGAKNKNLKLKQFQESVAEELAALNLSGEVDNEIVAIEMETEPEIIWEDSQVISVDVTKIESEVASEMDSPRPIVENSNLKKSRVRPDKNPNTKIGRAAMDLAERRRKVKESGGESPKKKVGKPKS